MSTWTEVHVSEAGGPFSTQKFWELFWGFWGEFGGGAAHFGEGVCRFGEAAREGVGSLLPLASFHSMKRPQRQKAPDTVGVAPLRGSGELDGAATVG